MTENEKITQIADILKSQNVLLDSIISEQMKIRKAVNEKNWIQLQDSIETIKRKSTVFITLDNQREFLSSSVPNEALKETSELTAEVRGKLIKSSVENKALGKYVEIVKDFVQGILNNVVPQRRNTLYSNKGQIVRPQPESVVLNQLF